MKIPAPLNQLFNDLRERKLLPIVALLAVGVIAVPLLLGGGSDPVPPPPVAAGSAALNEGAPGAKELEPVVLAEAPGLREYQTRLEPFQSRNPFKQQYKPKGDGSSEDTASASAASSSAAATGNGSGSTDVPASPTGSGNSGGKTTVETFTIFYEIDVKVGELGKAKKSNGVELLDYLPGKKVPVVQFVGVTPDLNKAVFVVSGSATSAGGDGKCVPNKSSCEFLSLSIGKAHTFVYEPNGRTYRIKLNGIDEVKVSGKKGSAGSGSAVGRRMSR